MATRTQAVGVGFRLYVAVMIFLLSFAVLGMFSIGMLVIPIPMAMMVGLLFWGRPAVVAGVVVGLAAGLIGFIGTAPFFCHPEPGVTDCVRWFLPRTGGPRSVSDWLLAVGIGVVAGMIAASVGVYLARQTSRR
jgi:hypothetical protein